MPQTAHADWCVCTIPASILSQIPMNVGAPLRNAINSLSYNSSFKVGLQFKRRFWEEDDGIFGGVSYTDLPIFRISYPSTGFFQDGPAVLMGGYGYGNSLPEFRFRRAVADGAGPGGGGAGLKDPPSVQKGIHERRVGRLASRALCAGLRRKLDGRGPCNALQQHVRHRRPDRIGWRTLFAPAGLARRRHPFIPERDQPTA